MDAIATAIAKVNSVIEEVNQEINANIEKMKEELREELRAELRAEFEEISQELRARIENLETITASLLHSKEEEVRVEEDRAEEPIKKKKKKGKRTLENFYIQQESYTSDEVAGLDDYVLCVEFSRLTLNGGTTMYCGHCKKHTPFKNWVHSIRARCLKKGGLNSNTKIPKTCDKQQAVNAIANAVNNRVYPKLRDSTISATKKDLWAKYREIMLGKLGITTKPYRYVFL